MKVRRIPTYYPHLFFCSQATPSWSLRIIAGAGVKKKIKTISRIQTRYPLDSIVIFVVFENTVASSCRMLLGQGDWLLYGKRYLCRKR